MTHVALKDALFRRTGCSTIIEVEGERENVYIGYIYDAHTSVTTNDDVYIFFTVSGTTHNYANFKDLPAEFQEWFFESHLKSRSHTQWLHYMANKGVDKQ